MSSSLSMNALLHLVDVKKQYLQQDVLKGISITINRSEVLCLLGPNGAGKTTLSSIIATLIKPSSGDVLYNNESIYKNNSHLTAFRSKIGFCPQKPNLHQSLTLYENLWFAGTYYGLDTKTIKERIAEVTEQFVLSPYLQKHAHVLSGGYLQRFMIARSLLHNPELLIFDEPTIGLDPHIRKNLWDIITNLKKEGVAILLTTHYLDEAEKLSDQVCILNKGEVAFIDTTSNVLTHFNKKNLEDMFIDFFE